MEGWMEQEGYRVKTVQEENIPDFAQRLRLFAGMSRR